MEDPRPEKVAVVDEVRTKLDEADGALLTEYRGLNVPQLAELRKALRDAGGEYKIYKNNLVRIAAADAGIEIADEMLSGPTAIAFVNAGADGAPGDAAAVAKALKEFAKGNDKLVLKGGVLDGVVLSADDIKALAELPSREVLLSQIAGLLQAPLAEFVNLLDAVPREFSYALQALIEKGGAGEAPAADPSDLADPADETPAEASAEATATDEPVGDEEPADAGETDGDNTEEEE
ncbi:MAG: 50S ribosomal protein L10 [Acidimicrobiales bacterium]|jgi:large subunit ribosomal protein L10